MRGEGMLVLQFYSRKENVLLLSIFDKFEFMVRECLTCVKTNFGFSSIVKFPLHLLN